MRSGQVNTFGVNSTGVISAALIDVQALSIGRTGVRVPWRAFTCEPTLSVNTFSSLCTGIVSALVDIWVVNSLRGQIL